MLHSGEKIGPYILIRRLGEGSFGVVWLAEKRSALMTVPVALKFPSGEDPDLEAIRHEAQIWLKASGHPNVLPVLDADVFEGHIVIVSEYTADGTLGDWLKKHNGKAPSVETAVQIVCGILCGLEHLHGLHLIHRDLKPANVLLQGETPRLTDFGLARVLRTNARTDNIAGTAPYMAPEMFGGHYSAKSDIWAAGVILYRLLTGLLPFEGTNFWHWADVIKTQEPTFPPDTVPPALQETIRQAFQKDPKLRFETAGEMREALQASLMPMRKPIVLPSPKTNPARPDTAQRDLLFSPDGTPDFTASFPEEKMPPFNSPATQERTVSPVVTAMPTSPPPLPLSVSVSFLIPPGERWKFGVSLFFMSLVIIILFRQDQGWVVDWLRIREYNAGSYSGKYVIEELTHWNFFGVVYGALSAGVQWIALRKHWNAARQWIVAVLIAYVLAFNINLFTIDFMIEAKIRPLTFISTLGGKVLAILPFVILWIARWIVLRKQAVIAWWGGLLPLLSGFIILGNSRIFYNSVLGGRSYSTMDWLTNILDLLILIFWLCCWRKKQQTIVRNGN